MFIVPDYMCVHPTTQLKIHKVHTLQVYDLEAKTPTEDLAYKACIWEGYCFTYLCTNQ